MEVHPQAALPHTPRRDLLRGLGGRLAPHAFPVVGALVCAGCVLALCGFNPFMVGALIVRAGMGDMAALAQTLNATTPLVLTGVATAISFRSGIFNTGVEGCFVLGGLAAAVIAPSCAGLPHVLAVAVPACGGIAAGAAWMALSAALVVGLGLDDVVATLMLNFVALDLAAWLVEYFFLAPGAANSATAMIPQASHMPDIVAHGLNLSFAVALVVAVGYGLWCRHTVLGYATRIVGMNRRFATACGFDVRRVLVSAMLLSGAVGGLAGGLHTLGNVHRYVAGFSAEYGFLGLTVAILGANRAPGIIAAAALLGLLVVSGIGIQLISAVPEEVTQLLEATLIIFASARWRRHGGTGR